MLPGRSSNSEVLDTSSNSASCTCRMSLKSSWAWAYTTESFPLYVLELGSKFHRVTDHWFCPCQNLSVSLVGIIQGWGCEKCCLILLGDKVSPIRRLSGIARYLASVQSMNPGRCHVYLSGVTLVWEPTVVVVLFVVDKVQRAICSFSIDTRTNYNDRQTQNTIEESCTQNPGCILIGLDKCL